MENFGFNVASASRSSASERSLGRTSSDSPKVLLPNTGDNEPPTDSMAAATCAAVRLAVSRAKRVAISDVAPRLPASSKSGPPSDNIRKCRLGNRESGCRMSRAPLLNVSRMTSSFPVASSDVLFAVTAGVGLGFNVTVVGCPAKR